MDIIEKLTDLSLKSRRYTPKRKGVEIRDQENEGYETRRGILRYEMGLCFGIRKYLNTILEEQPEQIIILDLGCGSGNFLSEVEAIDSRIRGFGITNTLFEDDHPRERIIVGNYAHRGYDDKPWTLPRIPTGTVDLIVSNVSLAYVDDYHYESIFEQAYRILKPNRLAILGDLTLSDEEIEQFKPKLPVRNHYRINSREVIVEIQK